MSPAREAKNLCVCDGLSTWRQRFFASVASKQVAFPSSPWRVLAQNDRLRISCRYSSVIRSRIRMSANQSIANLLDLSGQVALITGASRGIGLAIAELFAAAGARVALVARGAGPLEQVATALRQAHGPEAVLAIPADVAVEAQVDA